ncbi:hypothetical protein CSC3H3_16140 [Thalassospira marina]|uniref:TNase-like domain-containing protein n=2 Tax=Thalassospira marina TaxID=2048283 RepID=A0ABM6QBZ0_9PROT|nr:hypothetical protein CSC3H3_16140 [Thalassospira marina]
MAPLSSPKWSPKRENIVRLSFRPFMHTMPGAAWRSFLLACLIFALSGMSERAAARSSVFPVAGHPFDPELTHSIPKSSAIQPENSANAMLNSSNATAGLFDGKNDWGLNPGVGGQRQASLWEVAANGDGAGVVGLVGSSAKTPALVCGIAKAGPALNLPLYDVVEMAKPEDIDSLNVKIRGQNQPAGEVTAMTFRLADIAVVPGQEGAVLAYLQQHFRDISTLVPLPDPIVGKRRKAAGNDKNDAGADPRQPAYFVLRDGELLQQKLVAAGLAMVLPGGQADQPMRIDVAGLTRQMAITALTNTEAHARQNHKGMWAGAGQVAAQSKPEARYFYAANHDAALPENAAGDAAPLALDAIGAYGVIGGVLRSVEIQQYRAYLNFGQDWRRDFTVAFDRDQMADIAASGFGLSAWVGHRVLVRGVIENRGGPYVAPQNLASLCVERE